MKLLVPLSPKSSRDFKLDRLRTGDIRGSAEVDKEEEIERKEKFLPKRPLHWAHPYNAIALNKKL